MHSIDMFAAYLCRCQVDVITSLIRHT